MKIAYTKHARGKFRILEEQKFIVKKELVEEAIKSPESIDYSQIPLLIAQKIIDEKYVLRVVFKKEGSIIKIITFYPTRKKRFKNQTK